MESTKWKRVTDEGRRRGGGKESSTVGEKPKEKGNSEGKQIEIRKRRQKEMETILRRKVAVIGRKRERGEGRKDMDEGKRWRRSEEEGRATEVIVEGERRDEGKKRNEGEGKRQGDRREETGERGRERGKEGGKRRKRWRREEGGQRKGGVKRRRGVRKGGGGRDTYP